MRGPGRSGPSSCITLRVGGVRLNVGSAAPSTRQLPAPTGCETAETTLPTSSIGAPPIPLTHDAKKRTTVFVQALMSADADGVCVAEFWHPQP
jgi:hypothetical protein